MKKKHLKTLISILPEEAGIYQYFDDKETVIYVGKAKNIKKRVSSYFNKNNEDAKTRLLIKKIADIKHFIVETEIDALLLENNLIKKYKPKYNIMLKDDKSYPWICIKNERFPRIFSTRKIEKDGSQYFGPYTSVRFVRNLLDLFKKIYKLRSCNYNLSAQNIENKKFKSCLEFHIKNCKAPCINLMKHEEYYAQIEDIKRILKGSTSQVIAQLKKLMLAYAKEYNFEQANEIKTQIKLLENYQSKSTVVSNTINNVDVFSIVEKDKQAYVNYFKVINGAIIQTYTMEVVKKLNETKEEILPIVITDIRQKFFSSTKEIIVPFEINYNIPELKFTVPKIGDKKHLLELSLRNAKNYAREKQLQYERINPKKHTERILNRIQKDLKLKEQPVHIECFDNSNFQGTYPVSACVVFRNARPYKKDYRHYNVKTVVGANDFATMEEVIYRRYKRLSAEKKTLPQLIVIDGGKGQLGAAVNSLKKLDLMNKITVIGIAKRLEEIFVTDDPFPIYLDKNSESLKVIQHLRDEAHRFGITFHRRKRMKGTIKSELQQIKGIGNKTAETLLNRIGSVKRISEMPLDELTDIIGKSKAQIIRKYFDAKKNKT